MPVRLLVVDDDPLFRESIARGLTERGYDVVGDAGSAAEARDHVARLRPDAVLIDVNLPDIDGIALARMLLANDSRLRVLLTSSDSGAAPVRLVRQSDARGFIAKDEVLTNDLDPYFGQGDRDG